MRKIKKFAIFLALMVPFMFVSCSNDSAGDEPVSIEVGPEETDSTEQDTEDSDSIKEDPEDTDSTEEEDSEGTDSTEKDTDSSEKDSENPDSTEEDDSEDTDLSKEDSEDTDSTEKDSEDIDSGEENLEDTDFTEEDDSEIVYDVQELKVVETTIDSVTLEWKLPEDMAFYLFGYYFTINGKKSDLIDSVTETDGVYLYTLNDLSWRAENGTDLTIKVTTEVSVDYETKESSGVEVTAKTLAFDGMLPCFTSENNQSVQKGITFDFKAKISGNAENISYYPETFEFKSSDESLATVDENGIVTGLKLGNVKIMFKDSTGCWRYVEFTVEKTRAVDISFSSIKATVDDVWTSDNLIFTASNPDVEVDVKDITWTVSDSSIASVSDGKVTFIKDGFVTVTVAYSDNSVSVTKEILVLEKKSLTKDKMTYDEATGWYTNPEKTLRYNGKLEVETDWNKDGVWESVLFVTHEIENEFTFDNFEALVGVNSTSSSDFKVTAEPVVVGENKISVIYTVKKLVSTEISNFFYINNSNFFTNNCLEDGTCRIQVNSSSKFSVDVSANKLSLESYLGFNAPLRDLGLEDSNMFKISYEVRNITGNLDATIY